MKNLENARPGVWINCADGIRREVRFCLLLTSLIQEHYRKEDPSYNFWQQFDLDAHLTDPEKTTLLVWAALAQHEREQGRFEEWTLEKAQSVVSMFDIPRLIDAIQEAAQRAISDEQVQALNAKTKAAKKKKVASKKGRPRKRKV